MQSVRGEANVHYWGGDQKVAESMPQPNPTPLWSVFESRMVEWSPWMNASMEAILRRVTFVGR